MGAHGDVTRERPALRGLGNAGRTQYPQRGCAHGHCGTAACKAALECGVGYSWCPAAGAAGMEVASRTPPLVAGLARAAAVGGSGIARTSLEMLSKLCLYSSQGYCLALQVRVETSASVRNGHTAQLERLLCRIVYVLISHWDLWRSRPAACSLMMTEHWPGAHCWCNVADAVGTRRGARGAWPRRALRHPRDGGRVAGVATHTAGLAPQACSDSRAT